MNVVFMYAWCDGFLVGVVLVGVCVVVMLCFYVCLFYKKYLKFIPMVGRCVAENRHRRPI